MGDLHEKGSKLTQKSMSRENSPRAVKFNFFSSWTINGPAIPMEGCIDQDRGRRTKPPHKEKPHIEWG